jgi:hypothetical protein
VKNKLLDAAVRVEIKGEGRDEWGHRFFKFVVSGSGVTIPPFSAKEIMENPKTLFAALSDAGASIFTQSSRNDLLQQLNDLQSQPAKFKVVTRVGWNRGAFVLPGKIIGNPSAVLEPSFRHLGQPLRAKYRVKGMLKDWQDKIGDLCHNNSRLMFCASLGLTGPILRLVGEPRSGGFQLFGPRESGKTTAAMVTGSIWGCHRSPERRENGFAESWHTTAGKVEITALAHNETVLILDETKRAGRNDKDRAELVLEVSFNLAEGTERERLTNVGPTRGWRFYFLSTSNFSLDDLAKDNGLAIDDAERGRFVQIPIPDGDHGIYEDLHGVADGEKFTDTLKIRCRKYCGAVGEEFVERLVQDRARDAGKLKQFLKRQRKIYRDAIKAAAQAGNWRPLNRASGRFATVFAAGSLAIKYGIFRWPRNELLQAILSCQVDGLRRVPVAVEQPVATSTDLRGKLIRHLQEHRDAFRNLDKDKPLPGKHKFGSGKGYRATFKHKKWFYLTAEQLAHIIGSGQDADRLNKELVASNMMASSPTTGKHMVQRPIFAGAKGNNGHKWVHAFRVKILQLPDTD